MKHRFLQLFTAAAALLLLLFAVSCKKPKEESAEPTNVTEAPTTITEAPAGQPDVTAESIDDYTIDISENEAGGGM